MEVEMTLIYSLFVIMKSTINSVEFRKQPLYGSWAQCAKMILNVIVIPFKDTFREVKNIFYKKGKKTPTMQVSQFV